MSLHKYNEIKAKRYFFVFSYRLVLNALFISLSLNLIFLMTATYMFFSRGGQDYYSTNGMTNPELLKPMKTPNYAAKPLLADEEASIEEPNMANIE